MSKISCEGIASLTLFIVSLIASTGGYALPFNITPRAGTSLPTQIISGQAVTVLYTVFNNTISIRGENYVKYLPPNVTQITFDPSFPDLCGSTFTLSPKGTSESSCTLELIVSGPVNSKDPNPHHHLFVCFPAGITCAGTNSPLNVTEINSPPFITVGGSFTNGVTDNLPLAYTSLNGGNNWTLSPAFSLPSGQTQGELAGVICAKSMCTAVGQSFNSTSSNLPLAYTSSDSGKSWTLSSPFALPMGQAQGTLSGVSCRDSMCTAVGQSFDNSGNNQLPLAYTSSDLGENWTLSPALVLPAGQIQGLLTNVTCTNSNTTCTAVGQSLDISDNELPLAYTSNDGGKNWTLSPAFPLPTGQTQGELLGVTCIGRICTTVGGSFNNTFTVLLPLAYTSTDGGNNWALSSALSLPQALGELFGVTCNGSFCTAVGGSFNSSFNNRMPVAYTSSDSGKNWTLSSALPLPTVPIGQTQGFLNGVICTNNSICTAVGDSFSNSFSNSLPLAYTSTDGGSNWMLSSAFSLPSGQTQGGLLGVAGNSNSL